MPNISGTTCPDRIFAYILHGRTPFGGDRCYPSHVRARPSIKPSANLLHALGELRIHAVSPTVQWLENDACQSSEEGLPLA